MSKQEILLDPSAVEFLKEEIGGGEGIEYVELDYHSTTITQEQATALQNGALIKAINHNKYFVMIPSSLRGEYCTGADRAREGKVYIRHCKIDFTNLTVTWDDFELQLEGGGSDVEYITVSIDGGTLTAEQLAKVFHNGFVKKGVFFRIDNIILVSSGHPRKQVFNSTVINGEYYSMEVDEFTGVYTITEHTVGGIEFINLTFDTTEIDLETARKLVGSNNNNYIIELNDNTETSPGIYLRPNGDYTNVWTSNIVDGSYWEFRITDWQEEGIYVSIQEISVGGGVPTKGFSMHYYSTNAQLEPGQWNNQTMLEACQTSICFIGGPHTSKAFVSYADYSSNTYTFKLTGSTIEPGQMSGFGWDQENQCFFWAGDPK